jgi:type II secretory pathway pseudopilin PulG
MPHCQKCGAELDESATSCPSCGAGVAAPGTGEKPTWKKPLFISLAVGCGCLGLIFFLGLVSAILIPNFVDATQKAKQKRTVADIRNVGTAMMSWLIDELDEDLTTDLGADRDGGSWSVEDPSRSYERVSRERIVALLVPDYIAVVPEHDGWGHTLEFAVNDDLLGESVLSIRSPGEDGVFDAELYQPRSFVSTDYDRDVVWADGYFVRWPGGTP